LHPSELARFEKMVLPHLDDAYTLARYLVRDEHDARDVVQDAYLRAVRHFGTFRGAGALEGRGWLLAIVRNCAHTFLRGARANPATTEFDEDAHSGEGAGEDADAEVRRGAARETVRRALERLAPEFREVIVLRELEGLSYKEIAQVTGSPVGTVMSRLARARQRLLEALEAGAREER
jgi:RNA polymerase sigma-70 factor (ECF subfamily)